jgi:hypothetical protein
VGRGFAALIGVFVLAACSAHQPPAVAEDVAAGPGARPRRRRVLDSLERRTFLFFWERSDSATGLTPDRWPTKSFCSVGAVGFALTAYPIGAERGWVTREQAAHRVLNTLRFFWTARQDTAASGTTGYHGFFYHFIDPATGVRFERVELSSMDTALLLAGALFCQSYFDRANATESDVRALADSSTAGPTGTGCSRGRPSIALGWNPEGGFLPYDWRGLNETIVLPHPGARLADASRPARRMVRVHVALPLGHVLRPVSPRLRAAVRPPVLARRGSTSAASATA